jgi:Tol biopolymer transport system component
MTTDDRFSRTLSGWLHEEAEHQVPGHLAEVLVQTAATRQRPWWASPERWLPMDLTTRARTVPAPRFGRLLLVAALLIALAVAAILIAGTRHPVLLPFGLARNGDYAMGSNGDLYRFDPVTGQRTPLVAGPAWDFGPTFSRDGSHFTFGRLQADPSQADPDAAGGMDVMLANADGSDVRLLAARTIGSCWSDWSPDGRQLAFRTERADHHGLLNVLDVASGTVHTIDPGASVRCGSLGYRPTDGREIVFRTDTDTDHAVVALRPDGSGLRRVATCDCDTGALSPDGRLLAVDRWDDGGFVRLWLLDLDTGTERQVSLLDGNFARGGTFSPDGSRIAFPMLHRVSSHENAYQVAIAPLDGSEPPRAIGPEMPLPANGSDEAFVSITFAPDGQSLIAAYPDSPTATTNELWVLPLDGRPGYSVGRGTFASLDIQRVAP